MSTLEESHLDYIPLLPETVLEEVMRASPQPNAVGPWGFFLCAGEAQKRSTISDLSIPLPFAIHANGTTVNHLFPQASHSLLFPPPSTSSLQLPTDHLSLLSCYHPDPLVSLFCRFLFPNPCGGHISSYLPQPVYKNPILLALESVPSR